MAFFALDSIDICKAQSTEITIPQDIGLSTRGIKDILTSFLDWILGIIGMVAIISFAVSGFQYFFSAGDEKKAETAKRNLTYSIIGIIVALSGLVVVQAIDAMLRGSSTI